MDGSASSFDNQRKIPDNLKYKGKLVILANSGTFSRGEFTAMAFQSIPGSIVIGSRTSGADGDVSLISLPGGLRTYISGVGIFYSDGTQTQQVGVKITRTILKTVDGIRKGRDEILETALQFLKSNKFDWTASMVFWIGYLLIG